ncbi:cation diffusion facilitator family transporter [Brytella acorum]|uniref:cation diffusion facilitator family transporter n=1 Tax=Brytella acorum TaxID=2959299 RepID=UPI0025AE5B15|nr:cation diffusion facilitator family transporter [Brytella acorum]MDF3624980.1 cation diffusion facilitator family transporter [Brytella acorum]
MATHDHPHDHDHEGCGPDAGHGHDHSSHDHDHDHDHDHHDHGLFGHHHHEPASYGAAFAIGITLNVVYVMAEALWGFWAHALALLADAGHNLSDVLGLAAAWLAHRLAQRAPSTRFTYGLKRSTIISALFNAMLLMLVTGGIVWEAVLRLLHPAPVAGWTVTIVAAIGILINGGTALLLMRGSQSDLNIRGAFLHMASDALMSLAVVVSGLVIVFTGWTILDPIVSLLVSIVIVLGTWSLLRGSLDMALDAVPRGIDPDRVEDALLGLEGVQGVHHLHIWPMSTTETALTVHLVADTRSTRPDSLLRNATRLLVERFDISHPTFQIEEEGCAGHDTACRAPTPAPI